MDQQQRHNALWAFLKQHPAWVLFILALGMRLLQLAILTGQPGFNLPIVDEVHFDRMARNLADGEPMHYGPFFRPPFFSVLLSGLYLIFGKQFVLARILNILFASLAVTASYRLGLRLFDRRIAFTGGLLLVFHGFFIYNSATGLVSPLLTWLTVEALQLTLWARRHAKLWPSGGAGLLWGLAAIAKPVALLPAGLVMLENLVRRNAEVSRRQKTTALLLLGLLLPILPVTIRNARMGDAALVTTNGGINLFMGNNPIANGVVVYHPELGVGWNEANAHLWAEAEAERQLTPSEASSLYARYALRFLIYQPDRAIPILLDKVYYTLSGAMFTNNRNLDFLLRENLLLRILLPIGWGVIFPFALVGMLLSVRLSDQHRLAMMVGFSYLAVCVLFFVLARFRLPAEVIFVQFAAFAGWAVAGSRESVLTPRLRFAALGMILGLGILVNANLKHLNREVDRAHSYYLNGQLLAREDRYTEAASEFRKALEINPNIPILRLYLGQVLQEQDSLDQAIELFQQELALLPNTVYFSEMLAQTHSQLGRAYARKGELDAAERSLRQVLRYKPEDSPIRELLTNLIYIRALKYGVDSHWEEARRSFEEAASLNPDSPAPAFAYAMAWYYAGETDKAERIVKIIQRRHPNYNPARRWLEEDWRPSLAELAALLPGPPEWLPPYYPNSTLK